MESKKGLKKNKINVKLLRTVLQKQEVLSTIPKTPHKYSISAKNAKSSQSKTPVIETAKEQLESSHFRYLNEQLYTVNSSEAFKMFQSDPSSFIIYHKGFQNQVKKWPVNPLDLIIRDLQEQPDNKIIADFGCGTAQLAQALPNKVYSFDLIAANELVTACDMAHVPLEDGIIDIAVFCLSLMGTNVNDFLMEANRVLKKGGMLHIAEVESRCQNVKSFLKMVEKVGFSLEIYDEKNRFFFLAKFKKIRNVGKNKIPSIQLKPCLYKKR